MGHPTPQSGAHFGARTFSLALQAAEPRASSDATLTSVLDTLPNLIISILPFKRPTKCRTELAEMNYARIRAVCQLAIPTGWRAAVNIGKLQGDV